MVYKILAKTAILFLLLTSILFILLVHAEIYEAEKKIDDIDYLISKKENYVKVTNEEICSIYTCSVLYRDYKSHYFDKGDLKRSIHGQKYFNHLGYDIFFEIETLNVYVRVDDAYVQLDLIKQFKEHLNLFTFYIPLMLLFFFIFIYRLLKDEMFYAMLHKNSIVNDMEIMTAIRVGENTAHEIRTPLDVVTSKLYKIKETLNGFIIAERMYLDSIVTIPTDRLKRYSQLEALDKDFNLVDMSLTLISDQVNKMSGYKNILHSNGNKTVYDIIEFAKRSMVMGHDNLLINIDIKFSKYGVSGMKNSEMLSIFINHFKNSIEANSDRIDVTIISLKQNLLTLSISDNGNGIPDELKPHIFEPNKSSKQKIGPNEVIRGHGMFNNKVLITKVGGELLLDIRYSKGTMFIMTIPIIIKANKIENIEHGH